MDTSKMRQKIEEKIDQILLGKIVVSGTGKVKYTVEDAAAKFIQVLSREIDNHVGSNYAGGEFSALAREVMEGIGYNPPHKVGDNYEVDIYFANELHRESLSPKDYPEGIDNIIALLNSGYDASGSVSGVWTDHNGNRSVDEYGNVISIKSLPHREGAHFIEQAIRDFMGNYAADYHVLNIIPAEEYHIR